MSTPFTPKKRPSQAEYQALLKELTLLRQEHQLCQQRLEEAQSLARCGSWEIDLRTGQGWLSTEQRRLYNLTPEDDISTPSAVLRHHHPDDIPEIAARRQQVAQDGIPFSAETRILCDDGSIRYLQVRVESTRDSTGKVVRLIGTTLDITERKQTQQAKEALRLNNEVLQAVIEAAPVVLTTYNLEGIITLSRGADLTALGIAQDWSVGRSIAEVAQSDALFLEGVSLALQGITSAQDIRHAQQIYHVEFRPQHDDQGRVVGALSLSHNVTERKRQEQEREAALLEARERAERDPLTLLYNHRSFHHRLGEEMAQAQREGTTLAVVMLDLDNFKFFNDVYGHQIGDEVLGLIAERLKAICRPYDTIARFGGDEFALILTGVGTTSLVDLEARLQADLSTLCYQPTNYESSVPITLSLGGALFPLQSQNKNEIVELADARLRRAKTGAKNDSEAEKTRNQMRQTMEGFSLIDALVTAVDNKDRYTRNHSEDVLSYSLQIARKLGMDTEIQHTLAVAALLHDVGKIGVPDFILRKPGKLTEIEFNAVRQHAAMGAAIVSAVPGLEPILDCVRHHHERWDGTGYPAGLAGESIPLLARLMAVADAFSAMTTDRPYRQGMPREQARAILQAGSGAQWDPQMVEAFLATH